MDSRPGLPVRVFVVWEPVIPTDLAPPTTRALARIGDRRVAQYWDPDRALSEDIVRSVLAAPDRYDLDDALYEDSIVWDAVALFAPGVRWEHEFPAPAFYGFPVVTAVAGLGDALASASLKTNPKSSP